MQFNLYIQLSKRTIEVLQIAVPFVASLLSGLIATWSALRVVSRNERVRIHGYIDWDMHWDQEGPPEQFPRLTIQNVSPRPVIITSIDLRFGPFFWRSRGTALVYDTPDDLPFPAEIKKDEYRSFVLDEDTARAAIDATGCLAAMAASLWRRPRARYVIQLVSGERLRLPGERALPWKVRAWRFR